MTSNRISRSPGSTQRQRRTLTDQRRWVIAYPLACLLPCLALWFISGVTQADDSDPQRLSEHRDWAIYAYNEDGKRRCYAASFPIRRRGQTNGWADSWLLISNDPSIGTRHAVSFALDRPFAPNSRVRANVGKRTFELHAQGDTAWTADGSTDLRLIVAMKRGRRLLISAAAESGERVLDSFSLMGFTSALEALGASCRQ